MLELPISVDMGILDSTASPPGDSPGIVDGVCESSETGLVTLLDDDFGPGAGVWLEAGLGAVRDPEADTELDARVDAELGAMLDAESDVEPDAELNVDLDEGLEAGSKAESCGTPDDVEVEEG